MDCWHCRRTATGTCRFCGRGVCVDHHETRPFVVDIHHRDGSAQALVVENALWCGLCRPRPDPVPLPVLDERDEVHAPFVMRDTDGHAGAGAP